MLRRNNDYDKSSSLNDTGYGVNIMEHLRRNLGPSAAPSVAGQSFIGLLQSVEQLINEVAKNQMTEAKKAAKESRHKRVL
ncbi:hypothetical protein Tco_1269489 [Tanacetum coccineum]